MHRRGYTLRGTFIRQPGRSTEKWAFFSKTSGRNPAGERQASGRKESARGLAQSRTLTRQSTAPEPAPASWTAVELYRFSNCIRLYRFFTFSLPFLDFHWLSLGRPSTEFVQGWKIGPKSVQNRSGFKTIDRGQRPREAGRGRATRHSRASLPVKASDMLPNDAIACRHEGDRSDFIRYDFGR
jgi:hypothetical protein